MDPSLCRSLVQIQFAYAIESKIAINVANVLNMLIFPYFVAPRILHLDNSREFVNHVIEGLQAMWHTEIQQVSGRPRHPQSQGLVECAHQTLQRS